MKAPSKSPENMELTITENPIPKSSPWLIRFMGGRSRRWRQPDRTYFISPFFRLTEGFDYALAGDMDDVKSKVDENTAAILVELIQGEGGVLPLEKEFVKQLETLCAGEGYSSDRR